ncbi:unnamed protein product [Owenia fusiformis]|uniref:Protein O-mannosyl-transferase 2 n=1 Tax=Owenia fusiformis TaxID=6347 RepID=A0A8S4PFL4_OWEFU|nr:unnamed protein product [Owenia fusiformis]
MKGTCTSTASAATTDTNTDSQKAILQMKMKIKRQNKVVQKLDWQWMILFLIVVTLSFSTRYYKISEPEHVCWDETHFGKMGSWYINNTFFFDVHPPLGKMLIGLSGVLSGYDGSFPFNKPSDPYTSNAQYLGMRLCCATLGAFLPIFCFGTVWKLTESLNASFLAAMLVIFDTGTLTLSQYILLDPYLMFFIMASTFSIVAFRSVCHSPFTIVWWLWLISTGTFLACAISVKFVGLFVVLLVGLFTISDLWTLLADLSISMRCLLKHFLSRALALIVLPLCLYLVFFAIHFKVLYKSGSGDGSFSSAFQSQLEGNKLYNAYMPESVAYGSQVTLKNARIAGAYLHSHSHLYPEGMVKQQQVTTYGHKDDNNLWLLKRFDINPTDNDTLEYVKHGDFVRLEHVTTGRNLHSHREPAPITRRHQQVSCYGFNGTGDANDIWKIQLIDGRPGDEIRPVKSQLRLVHVQTGCYLYSHSKQLPKWGWEQLEVACEPKPRDNNNLWNIEEVQDQRLPLKSIQVYAPGFFEKVYESHAVMLQGNAGLKPKEGEFTSKPWQWPTDYKGQPFSGGDYRIYLLGNPIIFWGNLVVLATFLIIYLIYSFALNRGCKISKDIEGDIRTFNGCWWFLLAWALHYLPFWTMGRVLYFHHYFPAFLYNCMLSGVMLDYIITRLYQHLPASMSTSVFHVLWGTLLSGIVYSFYLFHPLAYGMHGPQATNTTSSYHRQHWLNSWDF